MKEKFVVIGAGSAMFTRGLVSDLIASGQEADLALVDIDPDALAIAEGLARKMVEAKRAPVKVSAAVDRRDVLPGATVVICTIGVGGRRAWEHDVFVPRKYGINMPVGDTVGPGGTSRALRMIPAMVDIAKDVLDLAPDALFFNYGNPMAPVCRAVHKATGATMIGLCHGVLHVAQYLARVLDVDFTDFGYTAVGINHLTWFTEARVKGVDALPALHAIAAQRIARMPGASLGQNFAEAGTADRGKVDPAEDNPFSWRLFSLFNAFPAVLDRHVTEFFPQFYREGVYYGRTLGNEAFSFEGTIAHGDEIHEEMRRVALSPEPLSPDYFSRLSGEHEEVIAIVASIRNESRRVYSVNLPNTGQVPNLPMGVIVESPAVADAAGLRAIAQPPLPAALVGTLATRYMWAETVVEAALECSRAKFVQALVLDGAVNSLETATTLADELLEVQSPYLGAWG